VCLCIPLIIARQRLGENPPLVVRQWLGTNVTAVTNTHATIEKLLFFSLLSLFRKIELAYEIMLLSVFVCVCVCLCRCIPLIVARQRPGRNPSIVSRQWLGRKFTAITNTHATVEELLDASFSMWPVSYRGK
jgi:hypothetical protein